VTFKT